MLCLIKPLIVARPVLLVVLVDLETQFVAENEPVVALLYPLEVFVVELRVCVPDVLAALVVEPVEVD